MYKESNKSLITMYLDNYELPLYLSAASRCHLSSALSWSMLPSFFYYTFHLKNFFNVCSLFHWGQFPLIIKIYSSLSDLSIGLIMFRKYINDGGLRSLRWAISKFLQITIQFLREIKTELAGISLC